MENRHFHKIGLYTSQAKFYLPLLKLVLSQAKEIHIVLDGNFHVLIFNSKAEKLFSFPEKNMLGKHLFSVWKNEDLKTFLDMQIRMQYIACHPLKFNMMMGNKNIIWTISSLKVKDEILLFLSSPGFEKNGYNEETSDKKLFKNASHSIYSINKSGMILDCHSKKLNPKYFKISNMVKSPIENQIEIAKISSNVPIKNAPHVLLVEDNSIALHLIETIARKAGCQTEAAANGEQALELIKTNNFDLLITDIGLPGMSGDDLSRSIREWEKNSSSPKHIPIVGLTALPLSQAEEKCFNSGMDKILSKPIYSETFHALLADLLPPAGSKEAFSEESRSILEAGLPLKEAELFQLDEFLLLDINQGIKNIGNKQILKELLQVMAQKAIPEDRSYIQQAYKNKNWHKIEELAHKMKSGTIYCGTVRLQYACLYLERYQKSGQSILLEKLYQQLMYVMDETERYLTQWLISNRENYSPTD
ncbi:response regulator [Legionella cardiaca]|uniref:Response regulator n=1 Tax=Legionella cardiaca TaxID=1071983 RepID=A0ABY8AUV0_9GAMM|nr:response regulator [Legionella cardiaca]WED44448.1 response regulator [Legionella cardiaca]